MCAQEWRGIGLATRVQAFTSSPRPLRRNGRWPNFCRPPLGRPGTIGGTTALAVVTRGVCVGNGNTILPWRSTCPRSGRSRGPTGRQSGCRKSSRLFGYLARSHPAGRRRYHRVRRRLSERLRTLIGPSLCRLKEIDSRLVDALRPNDPLPQRHCLSRIRGSTVQPESLLLAARLNNFNDDPDRQPQPASQDGQQQVQSSHAGASTIDDNWGRDHVLLNVDRLLRVWLSLLRALHRGAVFGPLFAVEVAKARGTAVAVSAGVLRVWVPPRWHGGRRRGWRGGRPCRCCRRQTVSKPWQIGKQCLVALPVQSIAVAW
jgi:hypothetical protein